MGAQFSFKDILDLEYFLYCDSEEPYTTLHKRDREIYLERADSTEHTDALIHHWINSVRSRIFAANELPSPGTIFAESARMLSLILPFLGLIGGICTGLAFFSYTGETPVNIFHFFVLFIISQLGMLVLLLAGLFLRSLAHDGHSFSVSEQFYTSVTTAIAEKLRKAAGQPVSASNRNRYYQLSGLITKTRKKYGARITWPFFVISQQIMIALNIGLVAATLFEIATSDLAFGWQSTISFSPETLFGLVRFVAHPWSWLLPEHIAYPSLEAIKGSKIILKDGIYHLTTSNLTAWWPFLVCSLLFYGLLFRVALLVIGIILRNRTLRRLPLDTPDITQVVLRMTTPLVSTQAAAPHEATTPPCRTHEPEEPKTWTGPAQVLLLVPEDIAVERQDRELSALAAARGFTVFRSETVMKDYNADRALFKELSVDSRTKNSSVIIIMESWMPPIGDTFRFIRELRSSVGPTTVMYIGMLRRPHSPPSSADTSTDQEIMVWKQKIEHLGDPYLDILPLSDTSIPKEENNDS